MSTGVLKACVNHAGLVNGCGPFYRCTELAEWRRMLGLDGGTTMVMSRTQRSDWSLLHMLEAVCTSRPAVCSSRAGARRGLEGRIGGCISIPVPGRAPNFAGESASTAMYRRLSELCGMQLVGVPVRAGVTVVLHRRGSAVMVLTPPSTGCKKGTSAQSVDKT